MLITLSRQFRAGAAPVAQRVAEALGWEVVDDAFIEAVAEKSGYTEDEVRSLEESVPTFLERFAQSSALSFPEFIVSTPNALDEPDAVKLAHATRDLIQEIGRRDRIVMVGRAAAAVLARAHDTLHVRLVASREYRIQWVAREEGVSESQAAGMIDEVDWRRARYHEEMYGRDWNDPLNYHMVLNTEWLGFDGAAEVVIARARALGW